MVAMRCRRLLRYFDVTCRFAADCRPGCSGPELPIEASGDSRALRDPRPLPHTFPAHIFHRVVENGRSRLSLGLQRP